MTQFKPAGWPSVIPRIVTRDLTGLARFLRDVFDAQGDVRSGAPTEIRIGDSIILISDGGGVREAMPAFLYVYVQDADEAYRRAIAAGAESIEIPVDTPMATDARRSGMPGQMSGRIATYRSNP
ncbi:hypothetical protein QA635_22770 [Bradyrhizobium brasilense]|uniref:VOC family protein n=1 Tax=Bradyrhizobium brasilense TaxID=1419277 RepID=UPI0024B1F871|nr:hypothetical protein [Bradyrhizobium australafricanum]WFU29437.1 hypothetical protein QA635_22770 [Bradyrhizobium australafricanum]